MAKVEILRDNLTAGGRTFGKGTVHDEKELGPGVKSMRERKLIGPVTKETKARLAAEKSATERPEIVKVSKVADDDTTGDDTGGSDSTDDSEADDDTTGDKE